jgi:hypothetical protein
MLSRTSTEPTDPANHHRADLATLVAVDAAVAYLYVKTTAGVAEKRMIMGGRLTRRVRGLLTGVLLATAASGINGAYANIGFVRNGSFELCLNGAYADWLQKQAELLVNQDPRAKSLDDTAVATWTAAILEDCRKKGAAEADSINHFGGYMARWREHVFDLATSIRLRGQSD